MRLITFHAVRTATIIIGLGMILSFWVMAQQGQPPIAQAQGELVPVSPIEILDEPKTVDPATIVPAKLAAKATVKFDGEPLKDVVAWLQREHSLSVIADYKALANIKLLDSEPVFEELKDAPLYLLLNRLETLGIGWYMQDHSLRITSRDEFLKYETTIPYHLGDFINAGYVAEELIRTISRCSGGQWEFSPGPTDAGTALLLGDVVFIRQTDNIHREVSGLLAALRKHGRRTFTLDAPEHATLRAAIEKPVTVEFLETPLVVALQDLSRQSQISIRLDRKGVRERAPVSLKATGHKLGTVLKSMLSDLNLAWYLKDDVLWVTTAEAASQIRKTAVFDVRDLCRDRDESKALKDAVLKQSRAKWRQSTEPGGSIEIPIPGVLVVRHTEGTLDNILELLENYRTALRVSKLRLKPGLDPKEVVMGYYRLPGPMADDLRKTLPKLILPNTWKTPAFPDAAGEITAIAIDARGVSVPHKSDDRNIGSENVVLAIRQTRTAHDAIGKLIQTLQNAKSTDIEANLDANQKTHDQTGSFGRGLIPPTK